MTAHLPIAAHGVAPPGSWRQYTPADGVPSGYLEDLAQDGEGFLWIAAWDGGVCRFDGAAFETFTPSDGLSGTRVYSLHPDTRGRLWIGTVDGGPCWHDGRRFRSVDVRGISASRVTAIFEDHAQRLWFAGPGSLWVHEEGTGFRDLWPDLVRQTGGPPQHDCWGMAQDAAGRLWLGYRNLYAFDGSAFSRGPQLAGAGGRTLPHAVGSGPEGEVWVGSGRRLWRLEDGEPESLGEPADGVIRKIRRSEAGGAWLCTYRGARLGRHGRFEDWSGAPGAISPVNGVLQTPDGLVWFATWGEGLKCCDLNVVSLDRLPLPQATALLEDRTGRLWIGSSASFVGSRDKLSALCWYEAGRWACAAPGWLAPSGSCRALCEDGRGRLWIDGQNRLVRVDQEQAQVVAQVSQISALLPDGDDSLLVGHVSWKNEGRTILVTRFSGGRRQVLYAGDRGGWLDEVTALRRGRDGTLWIGRRVLEDGPAASLIGLRPDGGRCELYARDGLGHPRVEDVLEDADGILWIATWGGIARYDGHRFERLTRADGLPNDHVNGLCMDRAGRLWVATEAGVCWFDGDGFHPVLTETVGPARTILQDRHGGYWFGTAHGVRGYRPVVAPPRVRITQVLADRVHTGDVGEIRVSGPLAQAAFEFAAVCFHTRPADVLYSWRLDGVDAGWGAPQSGRRVVYSGLEAGDYRFQVRAMDQAGHSSAPATVRLVVGSPLTHPSLDALSGDREAAYLSLLQVLEEARGDVAEQARRQAGELKRIGDEMARQVEHRVAAEQALRESESHLRELYLHLQSALEEERQRISREVHDDLGQSLTALKMDMAWLRRRLDGTSSAVGERLEAMTQLVNDTVRTVQHVTSQLRPGLLDDLGIVAAAEWQVSQFAQRSQIQCEMAADTGDIDLDDERATALFRILQELLTNVYRHARATRVVVRLSCCDGRVRMVVEDDGDGIPADRLSGPESLGLLGIRERLLVWGGDVAFSRPAGGGTTATVSLPVESPRLPARS